MHVAKKLKSQDNIIGLVQGPRHHSEQYLVQEGKEWLKMNIKLLKGLKMGQNHCPSNSRGVVGTISKGEGRGGSGTCLLYV